MLQLMRTGAKSIITKVILFGVLLLATLGLAVMDVQGMFQHRTRSYVAKMDGQKFTTQEFERIYQNAMRAQGLTQTDAYNQGIPFQILRQEMNMRLFSRSVYDMGLRVDDATVAKEIKKQLAPMVSKNMSEEQALDNALRSLGISEKQLVSSMKNQIAGDLLVDAILSNATAPQQLINDAIKLRYETRRAMYVTIPASELGKVGEPTEEDIQKTYEQMKPLFMNPEYRSFAMLTLDKKALGIAAPGAITDADVEAFYNQHKDEFKEPETRTLTQVIVKDESVAKEIAANAKSAADIKKAAEANKAKDAVFLSKDYDVTGLPSELSDEVFKAEAGTVIGPVKTDFGWHVVSVDKLNPAGVASFDKVRADIKKKLQQDNGASALYDKANEIDDALASGKTLADIAAQYGVKETVIGPVDSKGQTVAGKSADIAYADKTLKSAFALETGETSQLIEVPNGFAIVEVRDIKSAAAKPLEDVRADVVKGWKKIKSSEMVEQKTAELNEKIKLGESFEKIVEELGKKPQMTKMIARTDKPETSGISAELQNVLFGMEKKGNSIMVPNGDSLTVMKLVDRKLEIPANDAKIDMKALQNTLVKAQQNDILDQYGQHLAEKYDAQLYPEVVDELYAPKNTSAVD